MSGRFLRDAFKLIAVIVSGVALGSVCFFFARRKVFSLSWEGYVILCSGVLFYALYWFKPKPSGAEPPPAPADFVIPQTPARQEARKRLMEGSRSLRAPGPASPAAGGAPSVPGPSSQELVDQFMGQYGQGKQLMGWWKREPSRSRDVHVVLLWAPEMSRYELWFFPETVGHWGHEIGAASSQPGEILDFLARDQWQAPEEVMERVRKREQSAAG